MRFLMSASQIDSFIDLHGGDDACPRKWGLSSLVKVPRIQSIHAKIGQLVHKCLAGRFQLPYQAWANLWPPEYTGKHQTEEENQRRKVSVLARAMLREAAFVELKTSPGPVVEPTYWHDEPDIDTAFWVRPDLLLEYRVTVVDWKTVGSSNPLSEFVLQPNPLPDAPPPSQPTKYLARDVQAIIYAHAMMKRWDVESVYAKWVYGSKRFMPGQNPKVWIVSHLFTREETNTRMREEIFPVVRVMNAIRTSWEDKKLDSVLMLPHNPSACRYTGHFCDGLALCQFAQSPVSMDMLTKAIQG